MLRGEDGVEIGLVPRMLTRVYKVEREEAVASAAEERLTLDKFHHRMGHISIDVVWKLIKDNMITGVRLEYTLSKNFFCASCVYAKATRKSVPNHALTLLQPHVYHEVTSCLSNIFSFYLVSFYYILGCRTTL